ncbi:MAG: Rpp14/Pop5 family protein [Candidatus Altiarchaeota archaeon]|nr:Rpp14/Pop5 family protein [Candidatus Altiarchaeota archaeon]
MSKPLIPTLRERNRYIAFELISDSRFRREEVVKAVWNTVLRFLGEYGASRTSLWIMDWNEEKQNGILKVNHNSVEEVRAALALLKDINKENCIPHVLGISGTLKKTREKHLSQPH